MTEQLPKAAIVDMDGTWCDVRSIRHHVMGEIKDFDAFHEAALGCPANPQVEAFIQRHLDQGNDVVIFTARMYRHHDTTLEWMIEKSKRFDQGRIYGPFMRGDLDYRPDYEVKADMFEFWSQRWNFVEATDDNPSIVKLWNDLGIPVEVVPGWDEEVAARYIEQANKLK